MNKEQSEDGSEPLLDARKMDGPTMPWAPNDVFHSNARSFMTYHVMSSGYDYMTPLGVILGGLVGVSPLKRRLFPKLTALQVAGTFGFGFGLFGMAAGLGLMYKTSVAKEPKLPWDEEGIQTRVDGLSHNFMVRVMDTGVVGGLASAGGIMMALGGPSSLGLSAGALGVAQGISLGSAVGSFASIGCIAATKDNIGGGGKDAIY